MNGKSRPSPIVVQNRLCMAKLYSHDFSAGTPYRHLPACASEHAAPQQLARPDYPGSLHPALRPHDRAGMNTHVNGGGSVQLHSFRKPDSVASITLIIPHTTRPRPRSS